MEPLECGVNLNLRMLRNFAKLGPDCTEYKQNAHLF